MILETVVFTVPDSNRAAFEPALREACAVFKRVPGYVRHETRRGIERPETHLLLVWWENLEAHTTGFRNSPEFGEWRSLIRPHYTGSAEVQHFECEDRPPMPPSRQDAQSS